MLESPHVVSYDLEREDEDEDEVRLGIYEMASKAGFLLSWP